MRQMHTFLAISLFAVLVSGCASLQPTNYTRPSDTDLPWKSYEEAKSAAEKIEVGKTTLEGLKKLGFDPAKIPMTEKILDVRKELLPNPSSTIEELPKIAQVCYRKGTKCPGYKFDVVVTNDKGTGNTFLRLVNMKKETLTTGWNFKLQVYLLAREDFEEIVADDPRAKDIVVVFYLDGGTPKIQNVSTYTNKLGWVETVIGIGGKFAGVPTPSLSTK